MASDPQRKDFTIIQERVIHRGVPKVVLFGLLIVAFVIAGTTATLALYNSHRITKQESNDVQRSREAATRNCARDMHGRAEIWLVFQRFHLKADLARAKKQLPILDCATNLDGGIPVPFSAEDQELYVRRYSEGKLKPNPSANDVRMEVP